MRHTSHIKMEADQIPSKPLRAVKRVITTHNADGKPTFDTDVAEEIKWDRTPLGGDMFLIYTGAQFPIPLADDADLSAYKEHLSKHPSFMIPGGFVARYVDYHPGAPPHWHRTITTDFGVVVEGEIQLELEGGEKRLCMKNPCLELRSS